MSLFSLEGQILWAHIILTYSERCKGKFTLQTWPHGEPMPGWHHSIIIIFVWFQNKSAELQQTIWCRVKDEDQMYPTRFYIKIIHQKWLLLSFGHKPFPPGAANVISVPQPSASKPQSCWPVALLLIPGCRLNSGPGFVVDFTGKAQQSAASPHVACHTRCPRSCYEVTLLK